MDEAKHEEQDERTNEATDSRTLEEIEEQQEVSGSKPSTATPSPDAEANHTAGDEDAGEQM
jgi:hypothetical protein